MPQIKDYQQQVQAAGPTEVRRATAEDFGSDVGKGLQHLGAAGGEFADALEKRQTQSELSDLHAQFSKAHADGTIQYQQQLQDGTLDTEKFTKGFNDNIDKLGDSVSTPAAQNYFKQASAELKGHFLQTAVAGQAQLAGARAKQNYEDTVSNNSSALLNDPSSFELTLKMQHDGIDNLVQSGQLPAKAAGELKMQASSELAKSSIRGWINLDPQNAKEQLTSGTWNDYIDGNLKHQLMGEADTAIRAKDVDAQRLKRQQAEILQQQQTETQNDFLQKIEQDKLSTKDILRSNLDPFGSGSKEQFIKLIAEHDRQKADKIKTDPGVFINVWDRVHLPDGDPKKLVNENELNGMLGKGLTVSDINTLRKEIQDRGTQAGQIEVELKKGITDIAKGTLTKSNALTGLRDPVGDVQYQKWLTGFLANYSKQRQSGKTPEQLLSPDSPDYLGKDIRQYVRSTKQITQDLVKNMRGNVAPTPSNTPAVPRNQGESASDYLKRIGK